MKFRILDTRGDDTGFGEIDAGNCYLTAYAAYHDKIHTDLSVGESCLATFSLSGSKGVYKILRVS